MTVAQRILRCRLIEEAERDPEYAKELGLQDQTRYKDTDDKVQDNRFVGHEERRRT